MRAITTIAVNSDRKARQYSRNLSELALLAFISKESNTEPCHSSNLRPRNFSIGHCALRSSTPRNQTLASQWLARELHEKRRRTEVSGPPQIGSSVAVGRRNNNPNRPRS